MNKIVKAVNQSSDPAAMETELNLGLASARANIEDSQNSEMLDKLQHNTGIPIKYLLPLNTNDCFDPLIVLLLDTAMSFNCSIVNLVYF